MENKCCTIAYCQGCFSVVVIEAHDPQLCVLLAAGKFCRSISVMHYIVVLMLILETGRFLLMNTSFVFGKIAVFRQVSPACRFLQRVVFCTQSLAASVAFTTLKLLTGMKSDWPI